VIILFESGAKKGAKVSLNYEEAKELGLNVNELPENVCEIVWKIYCLFNRIDALRREQKEPDLKQKTRDVLVDSRAKMRLESSSRSAPANAMVDERTDYE